MCGQLEVFRKTLVQSLQEDEETTSVSFIYLINYGCFFEMSCFLRQCVHFCDLDYLQTGAAHVIAKPTPHGILDFVYFLLTKMLWYSCSTLLYVYILFSMVSWYGKTYLL